MPWLETSSMTERRRLIDDAHRGLSSMSPTMVSGSTISAGGAISLSPFHARFLMVTSNWGPRNRVLTDSPRPLLTHMTVTYPPGLFRYPSSRLLTPRYFFNSILW